MPQLSLIVPVYNVESYLRECLDSILEQSFRDIEVVVVNDASTDNCGHILEEYTARDPRITLINLEHNGGLGNARNVGLEIARGEYIVFVDSDDWLAPGALEAIHACVDTTRADVVIYDYARAYWHGGVRRNARNELFQVPSPDVFSLRERPDLLNLLMVVWNKVYRRGFIEELGLRFVDGYYEDLPWTYPVMMAAQRISLVDEVCYLYRQRRHGNILRTASAQHFDIFKQYERVFAFIDAHPDLDEWRPVMHDRMAQHFLAILSKGDKRVPSGLRRQFYEQASQHYRRFRPPGHRLPSFDNLLLRFDAYAAFRAVERWEDARGHLQRRRNRLRRKLVPRAKRLRTRYRRLVDRVYRLQPVDEHLAAFAAYWYRGYACNPRAIYEKLTELCGDIRGVWVVTKAASESMPPDVPYVVEGSSEYYRLMARAKYLVNNVNWPNHVVKRPGTIHLQTQHGTPLKTMGLDLKQYPLAAGKMNFKLLLRRSDRWDFNLSSNRFSTEVWGRSFPCDYQTLEYGYPRNDIFYNYEPADRQRVRDELGISDDKTVVLYAPTFRDYEKSFELHLDLARLCTSLGDSYVVLARAHYFYEGLDNVRSLEERGVLINVSEHPDVERLCLGADILLTDYSSIMFDYANLGRPIVVYADDWEMYCRLRGVNFDLLAAPPGAVARTEDELIEVFRSKAYASDEAMQQLEDFRRRFCQFDDGRAAERVVRRVFLGEDVPVPIPAAAVGSRLPKVPAQTPRKERRPVPAAPAAPAVLQAPPEEPLGAGGELSAQERYLQAIDTVPGWFPPKDRQMFQLLNRVQQSCDVRGSILEIGAYFGKSAILLGYFLRSDEELVVCDLFEDPAGDSGNDTENRRSYLSRSLTRSGFEHHYRRFHARLPRIEQLPSAQLDPTRMPGPIRWVHVDGSHLYEHVLADARLSRQLLGSNGLVVFDDYRSRHTPGVAAVVWQAVANEGLVPLCITERKFYGTWQPWSAAMRHELVTAVEQDSGLRLDWQKIAEHDVIRIS